MMSAQLGRPSGIQDRDIDVELPLNVDVDFNQPEALAAMQSQQLDMMDGKRPGDEYANGYGPVTSMTSAIHNIRLNQLKHRIQWVFLSRACQYLLTENCAGTLSIALINLSFLPRTFLLLNGSPYPKWTIC